MGSKETKLNSQVEQVVRVAIVNDYLEGMLVDLEKTMNGVQYQKGGVDFTPFNKAKAATAGLTKYIDSLLGMEAADAFSAMYDAVGEGISGALTDAMAQLHEAVQPVESKVVDLNPDVDTEETRGVYVRVLKDLGLDQFGDLVGQHVLCDHTYFVYPVPDKNASGVYTVTRWDCKYNLYTVRDLSGNSHSCTPAKIRSIHTKKK